MVEGQVDMDYNLAGIPVRGHSVGGFETWIHLPAMGVSFDIGRASDASLACDTILFTHSHIDHLGGIATHAAARALRGMRPPTYVLPPHVIPHVEALLDAWRSLDGGDLPCNLVPIGVGGQFEIKNRYFARPFPAIHRGKAQGYVISEFRDKLLAKYRGLPGQEIKRLREQGDTIYDRTETPLVAFTGDSCIDVIDREEGLRRARLLILEVTFIDDRVSVDSAREKGHVHLDEVIERADLFENQAILMTHFSSRYNAARIREVLAERLPESLKSRVTPLLNNFR
jgi:ribonuclease Z